MADRAFDAPHERGIGSLSVGQLPSTSSVRANWGSVAATFSRLRAATLRVPVGLIAVCVLAGALGGVGLTNEGSVTVGGDTARHVMNGVYLFDVLKDRPFASPARLLEHARLYYARYPALSLGHHPPLVALAEVPMYAVFGVSIGSAKLVTLLAFIIATVFLYLLVSDFYGRVVALFAAAFFVTSPYVVVLSRSAGTEVPTLALLMAAAYFLQRFRATEGRPALVGFSATVVLSLYAKQLAVFVLPAFLIYALATMGLKRLVKRDILVAVGGMALLTLPLAALTVALSPANVILAVDAFLKRGTATHESIGGIVQRALEPQLIVPILILAVAGVVRAIVVRDRRSLLFAAWTVSVLAGMLTLAPYEPPRYSIYWVPALCALAASVAADCGTGLRRAVLIGLLTAIVGAQAVAAAHVRVESGEGYEEAARFVVDSHPGPTVMFSGDVDTGLFTFFVRKHDPRRDLIVLRADKVLTTSLMGHLSVEDRIQSPDEIYDILRNFGTRYIVIEDRRSESRVLEWLRHELRSAKFVERRRIRIQTSNRSLQDRDLVVYEYTDAVPPNRHAMITMHLPLVRQSVSVPLSDLIDRKHLR